MKKKRILSRAVALALSLASLPTSALAASVPEVVKLDDPLTFEMATTTSGSGIQLFDISTDAPESENFGDQLTGDAAEHYEWLSNSDTINSMIAGETITKTALDMDLTPDQLATFMDETYKQIYFELHEALAAFDRDHPEVFWGLDTRVYRTQDDKEITSSYLNQSSNCKIIIEIKPGLVNWASDADVKRSIQDDYDALVSQIKKIAGDAKDAGSTRYEQLDYIHDWLTKNNVYNSAAVSSSNYSDTDATPWEAVSALFEDLSPVCEGYARAFKLLCNELDIPCMLVAGDTDSGAHMWAYVQMEDDNWYAVDVTFDDPIVTNGSNGLISGAESDKYFLIGENTVIDDEDNTTFSASHKPNGSWSSVGSEGNMTNITFQYTDLANEAYDPNAVTPDDGTTPPDEGETQDGYKLTATVSPADKCTFTMTHLADGYVIPSGGIVPQSNSQVKFTVSDIADGWRIKKFSMGNIDFSNTIIRDPNGYGISVTMITQDTEATLELEEIPNTLPKMESVKFEVRNNDNYTYEEITDEITFTEDLTRLYSRLTFDQDSAQTTIPYFHARSLWQYSLDGGETWLDVGVNFDTDSFFAKWNETYLDLDPEHTNLTDDYFFDFMNEKNYYLRYCASAREHYSQGDPVYSDPILVNPSNSTPDEEPEVVEYTVKFDSNGGSAVSSQTIEENKVAKEPVDPTRDGYTFKGWFLDGKEYVFTTPVTGNITLEAQWIEVVPDVATYTVTFDSNGGSAVSSQTIEENKTAKEPADPTRDGYTFKGWFLNGVEYDFSTPVIGNITLEAQWIEVVPDVATYTVTFDSKGGSSVPSQTIEENKTAKEPADPTRDGYRFDGWYDVTGGKFDFGTAITSNITLTAQWVKVHTVTFDLNGIADNFSVSVDDGCVIGGNIDEPTREGYEFAGWYLNGASFSFETPIAEDTTLTARWRKDGSLVSVYTVSFDTGVYGLNIAPQSVEDGSTAKRPTDPKRSGYTFGGWYLDKAFKELYDFAASVSSDFTLFAKWTQNTASDGSGSSGGSGGSSSSGSSGGGIGGIGGSTTTEKNPDGSTTTTRKDSNGTVTETTKHTDGSTTTVQTKKDGTVTTTVKDANGNQTQTVEKADGSKEFTAKQKDGSKATASVDQNGTVTATVDLSKKAVQEAAKQGDAIQLPIPAVSSEKGGVASTVTVELPKGSGKTDVVIPMDKMTPGTVAVIVHADGTEEVVIHSKMTEEGLALTLEGNATLKIVDNSKRFKDVKATDWFSSATDFVTSRNLFAGTSETEFSPDAPMTMEMLFAVAHNFMGKPERTGTGSVPGANPEDWFHTASNWAAETGLTAGLKMDMLGTNQPISREDTAILLFNLSGKAASYIPSEETLAKLNAFSDIADMDPANLTALAWAVENGIMNGMGDGSFGFKGNNTRAQTGAVMMNFNNNL